MEKEKEGKASGRVKVSEVEAVLRKPEKRKVKARLGGAELEFEVNPLLSLDEFEWCVKFIADSCVDIETGGYYPEIYQMALAQCLMSKYANINLPQKADRLYAILSVADRDGGVLDMIEDAVDERQLRHLRSAAEERIEFACRCMSSSAAVETSHAIQAIQELAAINSQVFDEMDGDSVKRVFQNMADISGMDQRRLAETVIDIQEERERKRREEQDGKEGEEGGSEGPVDAGAGGVDS